MRFLSFSLLLIGVFSCTTPREENFRQLDVNINRSIDYKQEQIDELLREPHSREKVEELNSIHESLTSEFADLKTDLFGAPNPRIFLLEEKEMLDEKVSVPESKVENLRTSILNYSSNVNSMIDDEVCKIQDRTTFHPDTFPQYFEQQLAPAVLIFLKKVELDCLQCKFRAVVKLVRDSDSALD